jgi:uncharacterized phage protein (TIGR01671 family)
MNRKIKFRMWNYVKDNPSKSKMFYDTFEVMACLEQQIAYDLDKYPLGYDHVSDGNVFMQFTGLLDKNGVEIYEGDIVKPVLIEGQDENYSQISDVIFGDSFQFQVRCKDKSKHKYEHGLPINWGGYESLEVIGNIYENPTLLTNNQ